MIASLRAQLSACRTARGADGGLLATAEDGTGDAGDRGRDVICVLQFDAAAVAVVERLLAEGFLPNLATLRAGGRLHQLETPATDFAAGRLPHPLQRGRAGRPRALLPFQWSAPEQRTRDATAFEAPPAVWERLAAGGLRTLAIDHESRPPASANGASSAAGGSATGSSCRAGRGPRCRASTCAATARPEATEIFGQPPRRAVAPAQGPDRGPGPIAALAEEPLARERFDLAWLTFSAAHLAGHQFWDLPGGRAILDPEARAALASALDEVYVAVDRAFGRGLAALPAGADVIVTSAVGMGVNTSRADLLPEMLAAVLAAARSSPTARHDLAPAGGNAGGRGRDRPGDPRPRGAGADRPARAARNRLDDHRLRPPGRQPGLRAPQPARTRARGGVSARGGGGADRRSAGLGTFHDPDGAPRRLRGASGELYRGRHADRLPDLVRWSDRSATGLTELRSERFDGAPPERPGRWATTRRATPGRWRRRAGDPRRPRPAAAARRRRGDDLRAHRARTRPACPASRCWSGRRRGAGEDALTTPAAAGLGS